MEGRVCAGAPTGTDRDRFAGGKQLVVYVALTFWLVVVVLTAWGVHRLWIGMMKPRVFNALLLPGTLVAQMGHVLGLLVTGATINNTTLIKDDEEGGPETTPNPEPKIPVVGPIIIGMLPLIACSVAILLVARYLGGSVMTNMDDGVVQKGLPLSLAAFWQLLRDLITQVENFVNATARANIMSWRTILFLYLLACLAIRIAPFPGYLRGSLAAIVLLGIIAAIAASLFGLTDSRVQIGWAVLNLTVAMLLFLLLVSLLVRGSVGLIRIIQTEE